MAHVFQTYLNFHKFALQGLIDWEDDTIKAALFANTLTVDLDTHDYMSDINSHEINQGNGDTNGYESGFSGAGRQTLANAAITVGASSVALDADDVTFATLGAALPDIAYMVIYKHDTSDAASPLLLVATFSPVFDPDGNDLNIQFNSAGVFTTANV